MPDEELLTALLLVHKELESLVDALRDANRLKAIEILHTRDGAFFGDSEESTKALDFVNHIRTGKK